MLAAYLWGADWAEILTGIGTVLIAGGILIAAVQVRETRLERSREIAKDLMSHWDSKEMILARDLVDSNGTQKHPQDATAAAEAVAEAVRRAAYTPTLDRFRYQRFFNFFEQLGQTALHDETTYGVAQELLGTTIEKTWQAWQYIIPYAWGENPNTGLCFKALAKRLLADRLTRERKEHRRYAWLTGGLPAWVRMARLDRAAWGPSDIPFEQFVAYLELLSQRTSLARDPLR
ncbi:MAG: hypothetical protein ACLQOZ_15550 [Acidimicrobiales bacterium]|jgi:hypothetical protein